MRFRDVFVFVCAARTREINSANIMRVRVLALKLLTESGEPVCFLIKLHTELQVERQHEKKEQNRKTVSVGFVSLSGNVAFVI